MTYSYPLSNFRRSLHQDVRDYEADTTIIQQQLWLQHPSRRTKKSHQQRNLSTWRSLDPTTTLVQRGKIGLTWQNLSMARLPARLPRHPRQVWGQADPTDVEVDTPPRPARKKAEIKSSDQKGTVYSVPLPGILQPSSPGRQRHILLPKHIPPTPRSGRKHGGMVVKAATRRCGAVGLDGSWLQSVRSGTSNAGYHLHQSGPEEFHPVQGTDACDPDWRYPEPSLWALEGEIGVPGAMARE